MAVRLDRETFMLVRHWKLEAYEKAYEIEAPFLFPCPPFTHNLRQIIGLNDLEKEKERILKEEMEKINEEYDKKRKDYETEQKMYLLASGYFSHKPSTVATDRRR